MPRRRNKGRNINGWVVLDKPVDMTSTEAVARVKRIFQAAKAGHAGTLDPLASGCLPIALGEATKTVSFVMDGRKVYRFAVRWGAATDTDDAEGAVVGTSQVRPDRAAIEAVLPEFTGRILQVPPRYSAVKVAGERAYDLARDGETVELTAREIEVHRLALVEQPDLETAVFTAECGKGAYVRALARDMGRRLGTYGHVIALRRLAVGPFNEADFVPLGALQASAEGDDPDGPARALRPVEAALGGLPALAMAAGDVARLKRGQAVLLRGRDAPLMEGPAYATERGVLVALGEVEQGAFNPKRVFHLGRA